MADDYDFPGYSCVQRHYGIYQDPIPDVEIGGGDNLLEVTGFVSKRAQLERLAMSGSYLNDYYRSMYPDYGTDDIINEYNPTVSVGYDFFDWHEDAQFVRNQLTESERRNTQLQKDTPAIIVNKSNADSQVLQTPPVAPTQESYPLPQSDPSGGYPVN